MRDQRGPPSKEEQTVMKELEEEMKRMKAELLVTRQELTNFRDKETSREAFKKPESRNDEAKQIQASKNKKG